MKVLVLDSINSVQAVQEGSDSIPVHRIADKSLHHNARALLQQLGDVDPERIVPHLEGLIEGEHLVAEMEAQIGKRALVPLEEGRNFSADKAVERSDALLAVEEELYEARS